MRISSAFSAFIILLASNLMPACAAEGSRSLDIQPVPLPDQNPDSKERFTKLLLGSYMQDVQRRLRRCWFPPRSSQSHTVVVNFKVLADGSVKDIKIKASSGLALADAAAIKAVESAAPLKRQPVATDEPLDIEFAFVYNVEHERESEPRPYQPPNQMQTPDLLKINSDRA